MRTFTIHFRPAYGQPAAPLVLHADMMKVEAGCATFLFREEPKTGPKAHPNDPPPFQPSALPKTRVVALFRTDIINSIVEQM